MNMPFYELIRKIDELNKGIDIRVGSPISDPLATERIYCSEKPDKLNLPEGYYYDGNGNITNKNNADSLTYTSISVKDIVDAKENAHNINEVNEDGLTNDEIAALNNASESNNKADDDYSFRDRVIMDINNQGDHLVNLTTKLYYKARGLYQSIKERFSKKIESNAPIEEVEQKPWENTHDDRKIVQNLLIKMNKDDYILDRIKSESTESLENQFKKDPKALVEKMKDYSLIQELHEFAVKDENYNEEAFRSLSNFAVQLKHQELYKMNRILQAIRYAGVEKDQMKFLAERLMNKDKKFEFDKTKKEKPGETIIQKGNNAPGGNGGSSTGSGQTGTGKEDTPTIVELSPYDKKMKQITDDFNEKKKKLHDSLGPYEQAFVDDALAEGLDPKDNEFNMMLNERTVDRAAVFAYLVSLERMKIELEEKRVEVTYSFLDEYEKMFLEDAKAENLVVGDNEFNMMLNERTVNQKKILDYYNLVDKTNKFKEEENAYIDFLLGKQEIKDKEEKAPKLGDLEQTFVDDAKAENLVPGDNEYSQMMNERTVDKDQIKLSNKSKEELEAMKAHLKKIEELSLLSSTIEDEDTDMESGGRSR